jgi:hypothetical protein
LAELAEGVENPGALERARLEGQLGKASDDFDIDALAMRRSDLILQNPPMGSPEYKELVEITSKIDNFRNGELGRLNDKRLAGDAKRGLGALDNLDPVEKARLDRAVQQGFDLDAYHGTKGDIQSFDPGLLGATTGAPSARMGFFFAADPETAVSYARAADLHAVRPQDADKFISMAQAELKANPRATFVPQVGENILPVKIRLQNPLVHDFGGESYREVSYRELLGQAKREGKDGAIFRNTRDGGPVTDIYVVFEPSQIRSRYAAFDPEAPDVKKAKFEATAKNLGDKINPLEDEKFRLFDERISITQKMANGELGEVEGNAMRKAIEVRQRELEKQIEKLDSQLRPELAEDRQGLGDITMTMPPVLFPLGAGTAAVAYSANQESD